MSAQTNQQHHGLKNPPKEVVLRIRRRARQDSDAYGEEFSIPYRPNLNIISCLMEIRKNPVTREGKRVTPPVWEMNCLEQVCGICTMVTNGRARQSCSALVDTLEPHKPITLEPMSKFPNVRDLIVDRSEMFNHLRRVHAWIEIDGSYDLGPGPRMSQAIAQVRLMNMHPSGKMTRDERLSAIMGEDGITACGNAQNCVKACPMSIPLTKAIYEENRETVLHGLFGWLRK